MRHAKHQIRLLHCYLLAGVMQRQIHLQRQNSRWRKLTIFLNKRKVGENCIVCCKSVFSYFSLPYFKACLTQFSLAKNTVVAFPISSTASDTSREGERESVAEKRLVGQKRGKKIQQKKCRWNWKKRELLFFPFFSRNNCFLYLWVFFFLFLHFFSAPQFILSNHNDFSHFFTSLDETDTITTNVLNFIRVKLFFFIPKADPLLSSSSFPVFSDKWKWWRRRRKREGRGHFLGPAHFEIGFLGMKKEKWGQKEFYF